MTDDTRMRAAFKAWCPYRGSPDPWTVWQACWAALADAQAAEPSAAVRAEAPEGYAYVLVPRSPPTDEPDWNECVRQAEEATGLKVERNTLSIVISEVRRWLIARSFAAAPAASGAERKVER